MDIFWGWSWPVSTGYQKCWSMVGWYEPNRRKHSQSLCFSNRKSRTLHIHWGMEVLFPMNEISAFKLLAIILFECIVVNHLCVILYWVHKFLCWYGSWNEHLSFIFWALVEIVVEQQDFAILRLLLNLCWDCGLFSCS